MSKKNRSEKEVARLRREVEFLKTQVKITQPETGQFTLPSALRAPTAKVDASKINVNYQTKTVIVDYSYLKKDLLKTALLAGGAFGSIFAIYFYQLHGRIF